MKPMTQSQTKDRRTTQLLRRLRGRLFRATRLLDQPDTPWRRRHLLDSLACHGERVVSSAGNVLQLKVRISYGAANAASGLIFPGGEPIRPSDLKAMSKVIRVAGLSRTTLNRLVVLDTETTGLLDEPGTVAFLVGLGQFEKKAFLIEQFFMEDYESEPAMMRMLARQMRRFRAILTYNGSAFDLPLLRRRFGLQRMSQNAWKRPHWDVLPTARCLWSRRVRSCSLIGLEAEVFGFHRTRDIESNRIPQVYRDYLGGRRAERLAAVFDHNAQDILTTAALALTLARTFLAPREALARGIADEASLARFLERVTCDEKRAYVPSRPTTF